MLKHLGTFYKCSTSCDITHSTLRTVNIYNKLSLLRGVEKGLMTFYLVKDFFFCFLFCGKKFNTHHYAKLFPKTGAPLQHVSDHRLKLWNIRDKANISCNTVNTVPLPYRPKLFLYFLPPIHSVTFDKLHLFAQPAHTKLASSWLFHVTKR